MLNIGKFAGRAWLESSKFSGKTAIMGFGCLSKRLGRRNLNTTRMKYKKDLHPIIEESGAKNNMVDLLIMGGGVTGSALVYLLAKHTNIKKIVFLSDKKKVEKNLIYHLDNTIHSGETDSNVDLHHSLRLLRLSNMLRNLVKGLPGGIGNECMEKKNKILLGLGEEENDRIVKRYEEFRHFFPKIRLIDGNEISKLEPNIAYLDNSSKLRKEKMNGMLLQDEYTSISYDILSAVFKKLAGEISFRKKTSIENYININVQSIKRVSLDGEIYYKIDLGEKSIYSKFLVINDIGNAFKLVRELGYCSDWIVLNMLGKFQVTVENGLRGIVTGIQSLSSPNLTSVYGFPEINSINKTRFLASSYTLPISWLLKSMNLNNFSPIRDFSSSTFDLFRSIKEKSLRDKIEKMEVEIPLLINEQIIQGGKKIIPSFNSNQLKDKQEDFGISINQLLDISGEKNEVILDRSKIHTDENLILNISQPNSGTTCIGSASEDMTTICNRLGININESSLKRDIPEYEIHESDFQNDL